MIRRTGLDPGIYSTLYNPCVEPTHAPTRDSLRAGELARLAGVSKDTLRHYERRGVLARPARARNGYRQYPPGALERVLVVRRALSLGFTLDELARILRTRDRGGVPCRDVRDLAARKLRDMEVMQDQVARLCAELRGLLEDWSRRLDRAAPGARSGLLDSLAWLPAPSQAGRRSITTVTSFVRRKR